METPTPQPAPQPPHDPKPAPIGDPPPPRPVDPAAASRRVRRHLRPQAYSIAATSG
jgi:hypothetical protein